MFWFYVAPRKLEIKKTDLLVSDSLNVYPCTFQFSADWEGLVKTAVFKAGQQAIEVLLDGTNTCNIPWEVLLKYNVDLYVGCYGTKGEELILNTTWTNIGKIYEGTKNKGVAGEDPTPDIYTQILAQIGSLDELTTEEKSNLVAAINEVNQDLTDYKDEQVIKLDTKVDKSGGTVSGPILFSESGAYRTVMADLDDDTDDNESAPEEPSERSGVLVSHYGILKNTNGPLLITAKSNEIDVGDATLIRGVEGNKSIPNSVPNMKQLQEASPTKVSQLENDSNFATKQYVQDTIADLNIGSGDETGTSDHRLLTHRNAPDQHPISAITGLESELNRIPEPIEALSNHDLEEILK